MTPEEMAKKVIAYVKVNGDASFVNMQNVIGDEARGDLAYCIGRNIVLWAGMSNAFCDALGLLRANKLLELNPTIRLTYMIDGELLNLPIAKRPKPEGYSKPHWIPCVLQFKAALPKKPKLTRARVK
jgi:hypothetical protein